MTRVGRLPTAPSNINPGHPMTILPLWFFLVVLSVVSCFVCSIVCDVKAYLKMRIGESRCSMFSM